MKKEKTIEEKIQDVKDKVDDFVTDRPYQILGASFVVGVLVGAALTVLVKRGK